MPEYVVVEKEIGETPLQALEKLRATDARLSGVPMTYAGRLDPMASGALLILIADECKKRDQYTALDKIYEFEVLFGASSDTGDILGLIESGGDRIISEAAIRAVVAQMIGVLDLPYPAFSSKTVHGIPLFQYALDNRLNEIDIPHAAMEIKTSMLGQVRMAQRNALVTDVQRRIGRLQIDRGDTSAVNDFRRDEVLASWQKLHDGEYTLARFEASVGGGTYIRALAQEMGRRLNTRALTYSIHRTKILGLENH